MRVDQRLIGWKIRRTESPSCNWPNIVRRAGLLLVMAAVLAPQARAADLPSALTGVHRIATMGDSITQIGGGPGGYVWLIQQYMNTLYPDAKIEVINAGISGHKSNDMLARYQKDVVDKNADLVTISVGINDVWHGFNNEFPNGGGPKGVNLGDYKKNVQAMIDMALKNKERVVLFTPTIFEDQPDSPRNAMLQDYVNACRDLARQDGLLLADQNRVFRDIWMGLGPEGRARLTVDGVHLSPTGNIIMARTALLAMGIPETDLDAAWPQVQKTIPEKH